MSKDSRKQLANAIVIGASVVALATSALLISDSFGDIGNYIAIIGYAISAAMLVAGAVLIGRIRR